MKRGYKCDNCDGFTTSKLWIFLCIGCEKEICESCMAGWGACKECAEGKTEEELEKSFHSEIWS
jgi:3-oxoacyl-(acyl-carrier-protein) synthase